MTLPWTVDELLPHSGQMILIDEVLSADADCIVVRCTPRADGLFNHDDGNIPAWLGIEYMAQAIAALSGLERKKAGLDIQMGFLLGTRHFHSNVSSFAAGEPLEIRVERSLEDSNGLAVFNCTLTGSHAHLEASINVFLPQDADSFLREHT